MQSQLYSVYFAPRGMTRMLSLGTQVSRSHLHDDDRLIGIIGDAGAGKSALIRGMFPGLELTNDDSGVNVRPLPILDCLEGTFTTHTYHMDARFELAFTQMHTLAEAIKTAVNNKRRVIVEHFDLIYEALGMNAELLIGVGEEVIVTRPTFFGPMPNEIAQIVHKSIKYRKMAHSAEDLTELVLNDTFGLREKFEHSDVKHGFVLEFEHMPDVNLFKLEYEVKQYIKRDVSISFCDETHVMFDDKIRHYCTGPRLHVRSTGEITGFSLINDMRYDPMRRRYLLVGLVGSKANERMNALNNIVV